jgi:HlyD family secretion protein
MLNAMTAPPPDTRSSPPVPAEPQFASPVGATTEIVRAAGGDRPRRTLSELIERENVRHKRRRAYWWIALIATPVLALAFWVVLQPKPVPLAERFRVQSVVQGDLVREVLATGNVAAVTTVQVGAEISGRIASVEVDYNSPVKAGQIMARFDSAILRAQLAQAEGALAAAKSQLDQAETDYKKLSADLARAERLHASMIISEADYEAAVTNARRAGQMMSAARAQLATQEGAARLARTNLDHATIIAPIDGIVITRNIDPGQTVASMLQTPVLFTVAQDLRKMRVIAAVDEADVGTVSVGQRATFTVDAYPDRTFEGVVTEVRNSPVVVQDVVTYGTVVEVANPDFALKPGMTASVHVQTAKVEDAVSVPAGALNFVPPHESAGSAPAVWVLSNGGLRRIAVTPGISNGELTAVTDSGLKAGDKVLIDLTPQGRKAYGGN